MSLSNQQIRQFLMLFGNQDALAKKKILDATAQLSGNVEDIDNKVSSLLETSATTVAGGAKSVVSFISSEPVTEVSVTAGQSQSQVTVESSESEVAINAVSGSNVTVNT